MIDSKAFVLRKVDFQKSKSGHLSSLENRGQIAVVGIPLPGEGEVLVRNVAAGVNFNGVWSLRGFPANPFQMIENHVQRNPRDHHHQRDFQIIGSDSAGIIEAVGDGVSSWNVGDEVVVHCHSYDPGDSQSEVDSLLSETQSIWGYQTNYGAFSQYSLVRSNQLLARPQNLTWSESASYDLTLSTAYRMLISENGANLRAGEVCFIWGAAGGLGLFAIQLAKLVGAVVIAIVSEEGRAEECRLYGADAVINRSEMKHQLLLEDGRPNALAWREYRKHVDQIGFGSPDVIFEHVGRETLALSIFLAKRGGRIVTCAATSGAESQIDLRYLWLGVKKLIGSHISTLAEAKAATDLVASGAVRTTVSTFGELDNVAELLARLESGSITGKAVVSIS